MDGWMGRWMHAQTDGWMSYNSNQIIFSRFALPLTGLWELSSQHVSEVPTCLSQVSTLPSFLLQWKTCWSPTDDQTPPLCTRFHPFWHCSPASTIFPLDWIIPISVTTYYNFPHLSELLINQSINRISLLLSKILCVVFNWLRTTMGLFLLSSPTIPTLTDTTHSLLNSGSTVVSPVTPNVWKVLCLLSPHLVCGARTSVQPWCTSAPEVDSSGPQAPGQLTCCRWAGPLLSMLGSSSTAFPSFFSLSSSCSSLLEMRNTPFTRSILIKECYHMFQISKRGFGEINFVFFTFHFFMAVENGFLRNWQIWSIIC